MLIRRSDYSFILFLNPMCGQAVHTTYQYLNYDGWSTIIANQ